MWQYTDTSRARADLAALGQTLELYRRQFGDYPQTADTPEMLYLALAGQLGPNGALTHGRNLLGGLPVSLSHPDRPDAAGNYFVDPWGNAYQYIYFTRQESPASMRRGYVLYSFGARSAIESLPTRAQVVPVTSGSQGGAIVSSPENARNIYAGQ